MTVAIKKFKLDGQEITLSEEQAIAFNLIFSIFLEARKEALIQGSPGTGKSFISALALLEVKNTLGAFALQNTACVAPSHKAKGVMKGYLESFGLDVDVYTVHSFLGKGVDIDESTGKQNFSKTSINAPIENYSYVWCDEFSMIGSELAKELIAKAGYIFFTGDIRQLPPINEDSFPVWDWFTKNRPESSVATLENPERYSGSIKEFVYDALEYVDDEKLIVPELIANPDEQLVIAKDWFEHWKETDYHNDNSVILAYTNSSVDQLNELCREHVLGEASIPLQVGEKVIAYESLKDESGDVVANNGSVLTISKITPSPLEIDDHCFAANRYHFKGCLYPVIAVEQSELKAWDKFLRHLASKAKRKEIKWGYYYKCKGMSNLFKPLYALTIHKSQGSGWNDVFFLNDFKWLKDGFIQPRLHYVAASRAKKRLFIARGMPK